MDIHKANKYTAPCNWCKFVARSNVEIPDANEYVIARNGPEFVVYQRTITTIVRWVAV